MRTSAAGRALIVAREGRRLAAYRDTKGILTIGVGHTGRMSPPPVSSGMTITEDECDAMLAADLAPVEAVVNAAVKVPMTQNEFDAMASLGFNIGAAGLKRSSVIRRLNLGDVAGAADVFMAWNRPAILTSRRVAERRQFLTPDDPNPAGVSRSKGIAAARSDVLAARASRTKAASQSAQAYGASVGVAGTAAAAVAAQAHHGHLALAVAAIVVAGVAINGLVAWSRHRTASVLASGAAQQAATAAAFPQAAATQASATQTAQPA